MGVVVEGGGCRELAGRAGAFVFGVVVVDFKFVL